MGILKSAILRERGGITSCPGFVLGDGLAGFIRKLSILSPGAGAFFWTPPCPPVPVCNGGMRAVTMVAVALPYFCQFVKWPTDCRASQEGGS